MVETLFERVRAWIHEATAPDSEQPQEVDTAYLMSDGVAYRYISVIDGGVVRCNLCGKVDDIESMPAMFEHVGEHDGQGAAEVDPTEVEPGVREWEVKVGEEGEPAKI